MLQRPLFISEFFITRQYFTQTAQLIKRFLSNRKKCSNASSEHEHFTFFFFFPPWAGLWPSSCELIQSLQPSSPAVAMVTAPGDAPLVSKSDTFSHAAKLSSPSQLMTNNGLCEVILCRTSRSARFPPSVSCELSLPASYSQLILPFESPRWTQTLSQCHAPAVLSTPPHFLSRTSRLPLWLRRSLFQAFLKLYFFLLHLRNVIFLLYRMFLISVPRTFNFKSHRLMF